MLFLKQLKNFMPNKEKLDEIINSVLSLEINNATIINAKDVKTDAEFLDMCKSNQCGKYGKCWMCPPDVGEISSLMEKIKNYDYALVFNQIYQIEDSFDIEGMLRARKKQPLLLKEVREIFRRFNIKNSLLLGVGGCGICKTCSKSTNNPCRYPDQAFSSLEAYGINVSRLAELAKMKYINGENTVTYFGMMLFNFK